MTLNEFKESLRLAFGTFRAHKLRSFLTILGVLVGVFTIIAVVSVITGLNNSIARDIESMGSNTLYVSKYKPGIVMGNRPASERNRKGITYEDAQAIQEACPAIVAVSPQNYYRKPGGNIIKYKDRDVSQPAFFGTLPDYEIVNNAIVDRGRFINDSDVKRVISVGRPHKQSCPDKRQEIHRHRRSRGKRDHCGRGRKPLRSYSLRDIQKNTP
jgi:putative ABC transport system permease protein